MPQKLARVFDFSKPVRFRCAYGGRGSGKSYSFALAAAVRGVMMASEGKAGVILCGREYMNSLDDSSMAEVKAAIASLPWLSAAYDVGEKYIRTRDGRVRFVFAGLRHSLDSLKSKAKILIAWVDEAESVSESAWLKLMPTVREEGSEVWATWNPERDGSPTDKRFIKSPPDSMLIAEVNHDDNPWFPSALEQQRLDDQERLDPQTYAWIWEGAYLQNSERQILAGKWRVAEFEVSKDWDGPYYGLDYGFALDPTAAVEAWIDGDVLLIRREAGGVGIELDDTAPMLIKAMPGIVNHACRADSARPESTRHLNRHGLPRVASVKKWSGSVKDGIQHLRSYREIVVHPDCREVAKECRLYQYKIDRLSGDIKPDPEDANNHYLDALRYALQPIMTKSSYSLDNL